MDEAKLIIDPFLIHLSEEDGVSYKVDNRPDEKEREKPAPDFFVKDPFDSRKAYVEVTRVVPKDYKKHEAGSYELKNALEEQLDGQLRGSFLLSLPLEINWRNQEHRKQMISELVDAIKSSSRKIGLNQETQVESPVKCKLSKLGESGSDLYCLLNYKHSLSLSEVTDGLVSTLSVR